MIHNFRARRGKDIEKASDTLDLNNSFINSINSKVNISSTHNIIGQQDNTENFDTFIEKIK
ncbi:MAG: hypothetical protein N3B21_06295 [Clostridia bacterium]|nr:hypothetical protein [Clostridia bacterium]